MSRPSPRSAAAAVFSTHGVVVTAADELSSKLRDALASTLRAIGQAGDDAAEALTVARSPVPLGPAQLARSHPGSHRERQRAQAMYERCLLHYRSRVPQCDGTADVTADAAPAHDDVGAALAHFVAANLAALHGEPATPQHLRRLNRQLVAVVAPSAAWRQAAEQERQAYVEQLGIIAVLISDCSTLARRQGAAAIAHVRRGARAYLRQLLGLDPDQLMLDDGSGLAMRPAAAS
jgi:hypothetical protein